MFGTWRHALLSLLVMVVVLIIMSMTHALEP
jgi:hypothetical protein